MQPVLARLVADVDAILADPAGRAVEQAVARAIGRVARDPDLFEGVELECCPKSYKQTILHTDPARRYTVVAIQWLPGQMSPAHDHAAWCSLGVVRGTAREDFYEVRQTANGPGMAVVTGGRSLGPGDVSYASPDFGVHRVGNASDRPMVSLHVYGLDIGAVGTSIRERYAD